MHAAHYEEQRAGSATYLVAWEGTEPLGSGLVQWRGPVGINARVAFPDSAELNHLQVRPERRGSGVGTCLIQAAEDLARARGHHQLGVAVALDNPNAARLYTRLGYVPTEVVDVTAYTWTNGQGQTQHDTETDQLLIKHL